MAYWGVGVGLEGEGAGVDCQVQRGQDLDASRNDRRGEGKDTNRKVKGQRR